MQAILLSTGTTSQLAPLNKHLLVPLMPIANRPLMVHTIELLARAGIEQIYVGLPHHSGSVEAYFGKGQRWNVDLHYLTQPQDGGTTGLLKQAIEAIREVTQEGSRTMLVLVADQVLNFDIAAALAAHRSHGGLATTIYGTPTGSSKLEEAKEESAADSQLSQFTGAFIIEPEALAYLSNEQIFDCEAQLVPALLAADQYVGKYESCGYWNPLTSFALYQKAQTDFVQSRSLQLSIPADAEQSGPQVSLPHNVYIEGNQISNGIWCGAGSVVHPNARLMAPVVVGRGCMVGRDVELGPNVFIGANSVIDSGASVAESTILPNTYVGKLVHVHQRVVDRNLLIDAVSEQYTRIADKFLLSEIIPPPTRGILSSLMERLLGLFILIVLLPVILLIALTLFLQRGSDIFARTARIGKRPSVHRTHKTGRHVVHLWRFRTRDRRGNFVGIGQWLEQWSLHRLPELWNVVRGEIGLVGVEPLPRKLAKQYMDEWQMRRFRYQMGFTGPWYTQRHGDGKTIDGSARYAAEIHYMATHTWRSDLLQLWWTLPAWRRHARALSLERPNSRKDFVRPVLHQ